MEEEIIPVEGNTEPVVQLAEEPTEGQPTENPENIDFAAELTQQKAKRSELDKALFKRKQIDKQIERLGGEPEGEPEVTDEDIASRIEQAVKTQVEPLLKTIKGIGVSAVSDKIKLASSSKEEADLIKWHLENSITPSGDVDEDIENAQLLANKKRVATQMSEIRQSAIASRKKSVGGGSGARMSQGIPQPTLSAEDMGAIKMANLKWDSKLGKWV